MLSEGCEKLRSVILNPKIPFVLDEIAKTLVAFFQRIRLFQVLVMEPFLVPSPYWRLGNRPFALDPEEEIDSGLLVGVYQEKLRNLGWLLKDDGIPSKAFV